VTGKRGFTLLEMMVATLIMAVAIVGLLSGISNATLNAARLREYELAVQLARWRMNELIMDRRFPIGSSVSGSFDPKQTAGAEITWRASIEPFEMPPGSGVAAVGIDRIQLEVSWPSGRGVRTFSLDSYRPRVLNAGEGK
jgi:general secretion pathway protein I